ncbi:MAG TPA: YciI family protein [Pyrinomonadaceae bacterium]|nr:YciI family protein [Pyrinomonadaceae bacterium]
MRSLLTVFGFLFLVTPVVAQTPEKKEPEAKLVQFQMALLRRGPKWEKTHTKGSGVTSNTMSEHGRYVVSLLESGKAVIAGPFSDDGDVIGVYVLRGTADEAKSWVDSDPGVKDGHLVAEMIPWWSEDIMKKPATPMKMTTAYLGFLSRGPKWTPEKTPATEELQKAHMANINRLAETKKLVVAGPFGGNGTLRGIFVFRVDSLAEAKQLAETDPAVQAGRLALDVRPWMVPDGVLP